MTSTAEVTNPADVQAAQGHKPPESRGANVWADCKHAGRLLRQYFTSDPVLGVGLILIKLGLGAAGSYATVFVQGNMASVTSALAERNAAVVPPLLFAAVAVFSGVLAAAVVGDWIRYTLTIRMRATLTETLLGAWLSNNRYYLLDRQSGISFPEQRIQEDIYEFVDRALMLLPSLIGAVLPVFLYSGKLWEISQPLSLDAIGLPYVVHGYLVIATVGFALAWTFVTHVMGSSLTRTEITRLNLEAKFRQDMSVVRENSESIAFQRGGAFEGTRLLGTFQLIRENWRRYTHANLRVTFATQVPTILFIMGPVMLCASFVLDGRMRVGDIQFVSAAMVGVYGSIGIFIQSYRSLALLRAAVSRLRFFHESLAEITLQGDIDHRSSHVDAFTTRNLTLQFPDGRQMVAMDDLQIRPGDRVLIKGPSGAGKSTFLRALAGLWAHGRGQVEVPERASIYFMPQRGYMPDGTLASLMAYPADPGQVSDERYGSLLDRLNLSSLKPRLHEYASWSRILSPGEQQRLAAARAIINAPDYLFVDEATSALDLHSEATLYSLLSEQLPRTAVISIAHRPTVERFHDRLVEFSDAKACEVSRRTSDTVSGT